MDIRVDILGIGILLAFVGFTRLIIFVRIVRSIKRYGRRLIVLRQETVNQGKNTVHYERAHDILLLIQKEKLNRVKTSFFGKIVGMLASNKYYEISNER
jgi:hypothetical protein